MTTLNEMANKLQRFIIDSQMGTRNVNSVNYNPAKYNNIKLIMDESVRSPHIKIRIGMSEATYMLKDKTRAAGGLGPDERYIRKWLDNGNVIWELDEIYKNFKLSLVAGNAHSEESDDYAIELDANGKIRRVYEARVSVSNNKKLKKEEKRKLIKKELKDYLKSAKRRFL